MEIVVTARTERILMYTRPCHVKLARLNGKPTKQRQAKSARYKNCDRQKQRQAKTVTYENRDRQNSRQEKTANAKTVTYKISDRQNPRRRNTTTDINNDLSS